MLIELERIKDIVQKGFNRAKECEEYDDDMYETGRADAYEDVLSFIESLEQEPEGLHFTPINRLLNKIPSDKWAGSVNAYAKKLVDCLIHEGYLKDAKVVQNYISYMNGNNVPMAIMDEQEPEVDLEKEISKWLENGDITDTRFDDYDDSDIERTARHFYELGLNARKEE